MNVWRICLYLKLVDICCGANVSELNDSKSHQYHQDTPHYIWFLLLAHSQLQENVSSTQLFHALYICVHCTAASHQIRLKGKKQSFFLMLCPYRLTTVFQIFMSVCRLTGPEQGRSVTPRTAGTRTEIRRLNQISYSACRNTSFWSFISVSRPHSSCHGGNS